VNSKERVKAALDKKPTDRTPIFMWFHPVTSIRLAKLLEIPVSFVGEAMGNDVQQTWVNNNYAMEGITHERDGEWHVDYWGIKWVYRHFFNQIEEFPLNGYSPEAVLDYKFPIDKIDVLLNNMLPFVERKNEYFIGCDVSPCAFEMYWRLRGMESALLDFALNPKLIQTMISRCANFSIKLAQKTCLRFDIDWLWTGDDVASQTNLMISPDTWREIIKPHLKRVFDVGKSHGLWVAYHCCGALRPIIPDLIEIGMDVLNPIQGNCPGMDPFELKREFGKQLTFMGGIDTQRILPYGSVNEVRQYTAKLIEEMTVDGGGYILAASHTIPPEITDEKIFAMYEEVGISKQEIFDNAADIRSRDI
jgi:uroporphyrinogen decarboxylase